MLVIVGKTGSTTTSGLVFLVSLLNWGFWLRALGSSEEAKRGFSLGPGARCRQVWAARSLRALLKLKASGVEQGSDGPFEAAVCSAGRAAHSSRGWQALASKGALRPRGPKRPMVCCSRALCSVLSPSRSSLQDVPDR